MAALSTERNQLRVGISLDKAQEHHVRQDGEMPLFVHVIEVQRWEVDTLVVADVVDCE